MAKTASPFALPPDLEGQKDALTTALQIAQGFALYFVISEPSRVRPRLMDELESRLSGKTVQRIAVPPGTTNLLHLLEKTLADPVPDVVFVYGFENTVSGSAAPRSHPLLLNLNATRNNLLDVVPRPIVIWAPLFVLAAVTHAAPDFISVRSGVYNFPLDAGERRDITDALGAIGPIGIFGLNPADRLGRIAEMQQVLAEYRSLPPSERTPLDEARILDRLMAAHEVIGNYVLAEQLVREALDIRRATLPDDHSDIVTDLNNLAMLCCRQERYAEADTLLGQALSALHAAPRSEPQALAVTLGNLGQLYMCQDLYAEAEPLFQEALKVSRERKSDDQYLYATHLNDLATVHRELGHYAEAEALYRQALDIYNAVFPKHHPFVATVLNNLASVYANEGRHVEAAHLFGEALEIMQESLGEDHPHTIRVRGNRELLGRNEP